MAIWPEVEYSLLWSTPANPAVWHTTMVKAPNVPAALRSFGHREEIKRLQHLDAPVVLSVERMRRA